MDTQRKDNVQSAAETLMRYQQVDPRTFYFMSDNAIPGAWLVLSHDTHEAHIVYPLDDEIETIDYNSAVEQFDDRQSSSAWWSPEEVKEIVDSHNTIKEFVGNLSEGEIILAQKYFNEMK